MRPFIKKTIRTSAIGLLLIIAILPILDVLFPLPMPEDAKNFAVAVLAEDGTPLRGFPDKNGVWRYPVRPEDVSPLYLQALLNYEDRYFYKHPGVNPVSLLRAFRLYVATGRPIMGGSTLTMQTARILDPHSRTIPGKMKQIMRALQLEFHYTKSEILTLYLNYAPFGGTVEGVQAASFAYLGKSAAELSHAEAALLAVLPQSPSRLRPDRHPKRAARARDKVLDRMADFGIWDKNIAREAKIESVFQRFDQRPMRAPLLARRLKDHASPGKPVKTLIDAHMQEVTAELVGHYIQNTPPQTSAAVLVVENKTLAVRAYVGSADFLNEERFGHVDMIRALRSPGSTLKPFLYAVAMEEGLIHSESLLVDAPISFKGYRPGNFSEGFSGPVSVSEALIRSLNIPAVDILDRIDPVYFDARLRQGGLKLKYPLGGSPNLSMILGGLGVSLEDLVGAYTALARDGLAGDPRFLADSKIRNRRMLAPGSAYIIRQILNGNRRTDLPGGRLLLDRGRQVAWKTGTSYGYRDAWAVGVTDEYTIGVWVGRPDGTPSPGQYGRATAAPLLFIVVDSLPRTYTQPPPVPDSVDKVQICWPLGQKPNGKNDPHCQQKRIAWILGGAVPPTLPDRADDHYSVNPVRVLVNTETGLRVDADCRVAGIKQVEIARWPQAAGPWLTPHQRKMSRLPRFDPSCGRPTSVSQSSVHIVDIQSGTTFRPQGADTELPVIALRAQGGRGKLFWMLDGQLIGEVGIGQVRHHRFKRPGRFILSVMDLAGNNDAVEIRVLPGHQG